MTHRQLEMSTPIHTIHAVTAARSESVAPAALRAVLDLQAALLSHVDLRQAADAFARELASRFAYDRVAVGMVRSSVVDVVACGGSSAEPELVGAAMAEALDQRASVLWPEPRQHAHPRITLAHRQLQAASDGAAASVPMVAGGIAIGAVTVERDGRPITAADLEALEHLACLAGPVLELMRRNERGPLDRLRHGTRQQMQRLRQPQYASRRVALIGAVALLIALAFVPTDFHVGGHARLEGAVQRVLVAPADGFLRHVHVRPGDSVKAGQTLIEMAEQDLLLERQRWQSQMAQYETAHAAANARADRAQLVINHSRAVEAEAQLALVDMKLERAHIEAPFDGIVIRGDLSQSLGAPVQQGLELMTIAPRDRFRVIVEVDERDIAAVQVGQSGSLALSALPWNTLPLRVTRITPMATALQGRNAFEVEAALLQQPADLRPGLQGTARIVAGRHSTLWTWSRRLVEAARLTLWEWVG